MSWPDAVEAGCGEVPADAGDLRIADEQPDGDAYVVGVASHEEGAARGDPDASCREPDDCGSFVVDGHPQVDPVGAGHADASCGEDLTDQSPPLGVRMPGAGHGFCRRGIAEQFEQQRLQDPARPSRPDQPPIRDGRDDVARAADGGESQVGSVALRVTADVHRAVG